MHRVRAFCPPHGIGGVACGQRQHRRYSQHLSEMAETGALDRLMAPGEPGAAMGSDAATRCLDSGSRDSYGDKKYYWVIMADDHLDQTR